MSRELLNLTSPRQIQVLSFPPCHFRVISGVTVPTKRDTFSFRGEEGEGSNE